MNPESAINHWYEVVAFLGLSLAVVVLVFWVRSLSKKLDMLARAFIGLEDRTGDIEDIQSLRSNRARPLR